MKRITIIAAALLTAVSCQEILIEDKLDGAICISLENSPVVEVVTKADESSVDVSNFNVYITSDNQAFQPKTLKYGDMETVMAVGVGNYTVYADNVTETASLQGWGEVRYACAPVTKAVASGTAATFELKCSMVNTAVSVEFIGNFSQYVQEGYKVNVWTEDAASRVREYTAANTTAETPAVGYFKPSSEYFLAYEFIGNDKDGNSLAPISGRLEIRAATHLTLQFKIKGDESGNLGKPTIDVNTNCDELEPVSVEVDPSIKNNN